MFYKDNREKWPMVQVWGFDLKIYYMGFIHLHNETENIWIQSSVVQNICSYSVFFSLFQHSKYALNTTTGWYLYYQSWLKGGMKVSVDFLHSALKSIGSLRDIGTSKDRKNNFL